MATGILRAGTIELEGEISYLAKASVPIGHVHFQLPGKPDPSTLYYGTWENVSDEYPGDFFRVEGGDAEVFDSLNDTEQLDQMQRIWGRFSYHRMTQGAWNLSSSGALSGDNNGPSRLNADSTSVSNNNRIIFNSADSPNARTSSTTAGETRPVNRTIRIWERIS